MAKFGSQSVRQTEKRPTAAAVAALGLTIAVAATGFLIARDETPRDAVTYESSYQLAQSLDELTDKIDVLAEVLVVHSEQPRWNSRHGSPWLGEYGIAPELLTYVSVAVQKLYWGSLGEMQKIRLLVRGDANQSYLGSGVPDANSLSGGLVAGRRYLVGLTRRAFSFEDRPRTEWTLAGNFQTSWLVKSGRTVGAKIGGGLLVRDLVKRLREARADD